MTLMLRLSMIIVCLAAGSVVVTGRSASAASKPERPGSKNVVIVSFGEDLRSEPATGRLLLLMVETPHGSPGRLPLGAPFWDDPQPIYSIAVENIAPGASMIIDDDAIAFPVPISELAGRYTMQAVLDVDRTTSGFTRSTENLMSAPRLHVFGGADEDNEDADAPAQPVHLELSAHMRVREFNDTDRVKEVELRSERLSAFHGREVRLRAGVVLPPGYNESGARRYAAIYHTPGFGGSHHGAWRSARGASDSISVLDQNTIQIHLNPDGPYGHHLFVNSENNGPVGDALVHELIPELERQFRLIADDEARLLTGHSSGGFTAAWLQVKYPATFGGTWATSPDPVDFRAFQIINIYEDDNAYTDADGNERPSVIIDGEVVCTLRQENLMERALGPNCTSGEQWASWFAAFSPRGDDGFPAPLWDPLTGAIDRAVAEAWKKRDLRRVIENRWPESGELIKDRLRIIVGDRDNFELDRAVIFVRESLEQLDGWRSTWDTAEERATHGYIEIIADRDHFDLFSGGLGERIEEEMLLRLQQLGAIEP